MAQDPTATMIANLPQRTGRSLEEWSEVLSAAGLDKHGQMVAYLKSEHGIGHGFANLIVHRHRAAEAPAPTGADLVEAQYGGAKAGLRPLYERLLAAAVALGDDVEVAPKKTSVSLCRRKQFALLTPSTRTRLDLGLNLAGEPASARLQEVGGMCSHKVAITTLDDIDDEVLALLGKAYGRAGPVPSR